MSKVLFRGSQIKSGLVGGELATACAKIEAVRNATKLLKSHLLEASVSGGSNDVECETQNFLNSTDVVRYAVLCANIKLHPFRQLSLEHCLAIANSFDLKDAFAEQVKVRPKQKANGDFRAVCDFGILRRTLQCQIKWVMECIYVPRTFQFDSVHKAISRVKSQISNGAVWCATLDIKNHFGSFDEAKLANLLPSLPKEWVENAVSSRHIAAVSPYIGKLHSMLLDKARQGISTGSMSSPIVAAYSMSKLDWLIQAELFLCNYADNFILMSPSKDELSIGVGKLIAAVAKLPGGNFTLTLIEQAHAKPGVKFLGHVMTLKPDGLQTSPSPAAVNRMYADLLEIEERLLPILYPVGGPLSAAQAFKAEVVLSEMCSMIKGWVAAFNQCDRIAEHEKAFLYPLNYHAERLGKDIMNLYGKALGKYDPEFSAA